MAGSTNALAVAAVNGPAPPANGAVFVARSQTAGRGQGANTWHASPGRNISLSVVAYPGHLPLGRLFALNQVVALAVARTLRALLPPELRTGVLVKYPNDVYVNDRKIAGILIQNGLRGSRLAWSVIGIGLNVNENDFPETLRATATSLRQLTGPTRRERSRRSCESRASAGEGGQGGSSASRSVACMGARWGEVVNAR